MNTDITKQMEMVLYRTEDDNVTVSALIKDETIWLTQKAMAELFGIDKSGIGRHYFRWLQSKLHSGNQVPYLGNRYFEGIYDKGLCYG